jgi:hypothetical protein
MSIVDHRMTATLMAVVGMALVAVTNRKFDNYRLRLLLHWGITWDMVLTPWIRNRRPRMAA